MWSLSARIVFEGSDLARNMSGNGMGTQGPVKHVKPYLFIECQGIASPRQGLECRWTKAGWGTVRTGRCHCCSTREKGEICFGMNAETIDYIRYMH